MLMAILGTLGAGKTTALTYLAWRAWHHRKEQVYSNYELTFPYTSIAGIDDLNNMKSGFFAGDELWLWLDAREAKKERNKAISYILSASRKRGITIAYTTHRMRNIDVRVRSVTDYVAIPQLSSNNALCKLVVYDWPYGTEVQKRYMFETAPIFKMFDTKEEVKKIYHDGDRKAERRSE